MFLNLTVFHTFYISRSMEELDPPDDQKPRCSVKELVARIQQKQQLQEAAAGYDGRSESSDDDDHDHVSRYPAQPTLPPVDAPPRSRCGVYSPTIAVDTSTLPEAEFGAYPAGYRYDARMSEPNAIDGAKYADLNARYEVRNLNANSAGSGVKYSDLNARFAKLRMLDSKDVQAGVSRVTVLNLNASKMYESGARLVDTAQDVNDNNDSGYSTKVYGSSKGNSPSLSGGQVEGECLGSSSLV